MIIEHILQIGHLSAVIIYYSKFK